MRQGAGHNGGVRTRNRWSTFMGVNALMTVSFGAIGAPSMMGRATPVADWFGDWVPDIRAGVDARLSEIDAARALPLLVA